MSGSVQHLRAEFFLSVAVVSDLKSLEDTHNSVDECIFTYFIQSGKTSRSDGSISQMLLATKPVCFLMIQKTKF